ncbi:mevalonate kinase [Facklamia lactis]|uniref:mevalonate kinase n=1 Tax=Facklamia lactis TaxID=2749967 RepID=UPI0018CCF0D4|nr:mevalonate kinase [Facklamia lactis]MBG9980568.1 mevalonate kinase [Facklamia lactis]
MDPHYNHLPPKIPAPPTKKIGTGQAHSKIILMGEHAVVYDYPAIAMPFTAVQVEVKVHASHKPYTSIDCQYYRGPLEQIPEHLENLKTALHLAIESMRLKEIPLDIKIESTIPQERGMGSSAAVVVALIRAICDFYHVQISDYQLRLITNEAEVIAHQSTSGIDTLVTSSSNPIIYRKSQKPHSFKLDLDAFLIVADSGQAGRTSLAVNHVHELKKVKPHFVEQAMATIGRFVNQAYQAIRLGDRTELGRLMTYNHYYLNQLGISNQELDRIVNAAWLAGALGAKLTGGGLGGCVIALAEDQHHGEIISEAMMKAGASKAWLLNLSPVK